MAQAQSVQAINQREKRGSVTYSTDRENKVSKIFIVSEVNREHGERKLSDLAGHTVEYGLQN